MFERSKAEFVQMSRVGVERFGPGERSTSFEPGDFILTHGDAFVSKMIRFGQRIRIHGDDSKYTHWNHAALIVSEDGDIIEALGGGVSKTHISHYAESEYHLVHIIASPEDREQVVAFGVWAAGVGVGCKKQRYGFLTIASIAFTTLTGGKFTFAIDGQAICSGLVARAMERTGGLFNRAPTHIMPADLAKYYDVEPPNEN